MTVITLVTVGPTVLGKVFLKAFSILTHIGKLSGNDPGDFPETFSKKKFLLYCDVTTDDN